MTTPCASSPATRWATAPPTTSPPSTWTAARQARTWMRAKWPTSTLNLNSDPCTVWSARRLAIQGARMHLMFEDAAGATTFADSSGQHNAANCSGNGCPAAAQAGKSAARSPSTAWTTRCASRTLAILPAPRFPPGSIAPALLTDGRRWSHTRPTARAAFALLLNEGNRGHQPGFLVNVDGTWQYVEDTASVPLNTWVHLAGHVQWRSAPTLPGWRVGGRTGCPPASYRQCTETDRHRRAALRRYALLPRPPR